MIHRNLLTFGLILTAFLNGVFSATLQAMSVEDAYQTIPHRRTVFDPSQSNIPQDEKTFLAQFFGLLDQAVTLRVETFEQIHKQENAAELEPRYQKLLNQLEALTPPSQLKKVHQEVLSAIQEQRDFLLDLKNHSGQQDAAQHPKVKSSSERLRKAYDTLMLRYPKETEQNKNAFFDYLCALDFV